MNRYAQPNTADRPKQSHQVAEDVANSIPTGDAFDAIDLTLSISERIKQVYQGTYNVLKLVLNNSNLNKVIPNKSNTNNNEIIIQLRNFLRTMDPNSPVADNQKVVIQIWNFLCSVDLNNPVADNQKIVTQFEHFLRTMNPNSLAAKIIDWISIGYILTVVVRI